MNIPKEIVKTILESESFVTHIHLSPDPDAIGATLALKLGLESIGKVVHLFCEEPLIKVADFLDGVDEVQTMSLGNALTYPHDAFLCLDTAKWELGARQAVGIEFPKPVIVIDHHPDNSIEAKLKWVDGKASSAAEMVGKLLEKLEIEITPAIATNLLFGVMGDTGVFQNTNTTPAVLRFVSKMIAKGGNYNTCVTALLRSYEFAETEVWSRLLANIKRSDDHKYVWSTLSHEECASFSIEPQMGVLANLFIARIYGTEFGAVLVEKEIGITKGSLRSRRPEFDVSEIAHILGGGGHKNAAAFKLMKTLDDAEHEFLKVARSVISKKK